jgi:carbon-monoxide dehydrogenase large subunit
MGAYRGAGRPEATALLERAVDQAALELGIDPIEIRRATCWPTTCSRSHTLTGVTYDSGAYATPLDTAAWHRVRRPAREQAARRERGDRRLLGIGVATYVEVTAGGGSSEYGAVDGPPRRHGHGDGRHLGARPGPPDGVRDDRQRADRHPGRQDPADATSTPTWCAAAAAPGARVRCSWAVRRCIEGHRGRGHKARQLAARLLEADEADIVVDTAAGTVGVAGVPSSALDWAALALAAESA